MMKLSKIVGLVASHSLIGFLGFAAGIYLLPILIAPPAPSEQTIKQAAANSIYQAQFHRNLKDSDALHWGEGKVSVGTYAITLTGELAPGPDYRLYLSPEFVETELDFNRLKSQMVLVGDIKTFDNFIVKVPEDIDVSAYNSVIVWCESFGQFITAGQYQ